MSSYIDMEGWAYHFLYLCLSILFVMFDMDFSAPSAILDFWITFLIGLWIGFQKHESLLLEMGHIGNISSDPSCIVLFLNGVGGQPRQCQSSYIRFHYVYKPISLKGMEILRQSGRGSKTLDLCSTSSRI